MKTNVIEDRKPFFSKTNLPDLIFWIMAVILPESLRFTEAETYRYLRICGSRLRGSEVSMLVTLS